MKPTIQVDFKSFNAVLREIVRTSSREAPDVLNSRLRFILIKALRFTVKANAEKIAFELGRIGSTLGFTKKGRLRKGGRGSKALLRNDSFAARIVNARRRDFAGPDFMLWGAALDQAAAKLIAARVRSVGFIKSGWLWALRQLAPFVKSGPRANPDREARAFGQPKGMAIPARNNARGVFEARAENRALIAGGGKFRAEGAHNPLPVAEAGLARAFADEKTEMERHLREKLVKAARAAGATAH